MKFGIKTESRCELGGKTNSGRKGQTSGGRCSATAYNGPDVIKSR